ncbi:MAG: hypothetical protein A2951_00320 [Candidatus Buchananbacteria bacterium RIFCSPLOWO2_01_FULL_56_15]|uniref:DUF3006 domain-containing protein n=2 Tax=Candidatus Buchananiibacteriota TaxID=1817903 RepID=A0A1G1YLU2_9BACT|nr:MAG: hypothetical protein A3J59_00725 [Candidatus Buchananbacteria bacterium RIFCSPHIGHO2_02_FULL_56_16]OGY54751.1 MAG: hypothetical protein A2951_00320 [Candidatus Buchananbacteria bacterium RIFCSPLOWO2_01_FULL_56_15]
MTKPQNAIDDSYSLSVTVAQFDGTDALLTAPDGNTIRWPIKQLPDDVAVGTRLRLLARTSASERLEREQAAKAILNEILKTDS